MAGVNDRKAGFMDRYHEKLDADNNRETLLEIARILAAGLLRLHARAALVAPETPQESSPSGLEVPGKKVLIGAREVNKPEVSLRRNTWS
jgi:hypothetical protein